MENKETFNSIANEYEKYRPTYPNEMYNDIFDYSNPDREDKILEIGCGTGQATRGMIERGYKQITCIEYGDRLAQFTAEKFNSYETIKVINSSFEEWNGEVGSF
ncbi:rRNA adenine N-6-methyltransferase family protein [Paenibacillus sp. 7516]|uniref:rRNA adenine N-6-methyltransferase family protein n=1 Tax=Paenibacillus sp. 7516 TaxID=2022549 RepID=UPI000BA56770|nr:rRNA adenine N-6-methyltransferase family protein [Paenibacillus sp. 7516]PAF33048.1 hypothetical protein CHI14_06850 [Paenibacillus sp. 7516]